VTGSPFWNVCGVVTVVEEMLDPSTTSVSRLMAGSCSLSLRSSTL
jgi:hypothetical protein